jgi:hypothetical protein
MELFGAFITDCFSKGVCCCASFLCFFLGVVCEQRNVMMEVVFVAACDDV